MHQALLWGLVLAMALISAMADTGAEDPTLAHATSRKEGYHGLEYANPPEHHERRCHPGYGVAGFGGSSSSYGYYEDAAPKHDSQGCQRCPEGTYSAGGPNAYCKACGPYQTSPPGSPAPEFCDCLPGYGRDVSGACALCPLGSYWPGPPASAANVAVAAAATPQALQACLPCSAISPTGGWTTLAPGAGSPQACVCQPGHAGPFCSECSATQICPGGTRDKPQVCPTNAYAPAGATDATQCLCKPGTGRPAFFSGPGLQCDVCPPGTYSEGGTTDSCKQCNEGFLSPPGSDSPSDCLPGGQNLGYCCGTAKCATVVPQPPNELPARIQVPEKRAPYVRRAGKARFPLPNVQPSTKAGVKPETVCSATPRSEVSFPFNGIAAANVLINIFYQDDNNPACPWNSGVLAERPFSTCTGNLLAPHLVLTAAHCVEPALVRAKAPDCPNARLAAVAVCFNYNPGNGAPDYECPIGPDTQVALGASWFPRTDSGQPHDQAIIFLPDARPGPYFQYNYIENINTQLPTNTWLARSYTGEGSATRCGCIQCPSIPCNLATSGPTTRPVTVQANGAFNTGMEACAGSSGSAVTVNGATCAVGINSYESNSAGTPACASTCSNFFSSISKDAPLTTLWNQMMVSTGNP